jgi:hypothetical protein
MENIHISIIPPPDNIPSPTIKHTDIARTPELGTARGTIAGTSVVRCNSGGIRGLSGDGLLSQDKDVQSSSDNMSSIDKLTLELLINKSQYKKYVQKTDPHKHGETQIYLGKIIKYQNKIEHLFLSLLENPEMQITTDINNDFSNFVKTCIQYFELKPSDNSYNQEDDADIMFDANLMNNTSTPPQNTMTAISHDNILYSMWGKKIRKV